MKKENKNKNETKTMTIQWNLFKLKIMKKKN